MEFFRFGILGGGVDKFRGVKRLLIAIENALTNVRREANRYIARLGAEVRKSKRSLEVPYPAELTQAIDTYISHVRPLLARAKRLEEIESDALWLSREGRRISSCNVTHRVKKLSLTHLGRDLTPHLIRDCAATSIATKAPKDVGITRNILGHATLRMSRNTTIRQAWFRFCSGFTRSYLP
jgi:site-specific recombinase XerC